MDRERLQRLAIQWGALALVAQIWIALLFEQKLREFWNDALEGFGGFAQFCDRISQLKSPPFKAPWSIVYFAIFAILVIAITASLWIYGMRDALAEERRDDDANVD